MTGARTLAPPERRFAEVLECRRVGAYTLLTAADCDGPADPRPGQFYMLSAGAHWGGGSAERPYLPRAFSFARVRSHSGGGAALEFLLEDVGPGTHRLGLLGTGEALGLVGPLGVGFQPAFGAAQPLLVGGGIGIAPLLCLHDELVEAGVSPAVALGFRSAAHAEAATLFDGEVTVATDDGSAGRQGVVTEVLIEQLDAGAPATVYACGPPSMLEAVRVLCAERSVSAQLALEAGMACGFGACFGCVVPTREGYIRVCVDGPVVEGALLETALVAGGGHQG
ncbi:MAG: dihydroorotate dehydrogenase electron transfer subunit [Actinomycetota bacterium]|nr:dihydroorotate dehydrogenase electron transfer subunit [Actinomycetota bacterium]